jgi:alanyl-tRNA synthetase
MSAQTVDGKQLFPGALLFWLRDTHGLPLDFALDRIINEKAMVVEWPGFVAAARNQKWKDARIIEAVAVGLADAGVPRELQQGIGLGIARFMGYAA